MLKTNYHVGRAAAAAVFLPFVLFAISSAADEYLTQTPKTQTSQAPLSVTPAYPAPAQATPAATTTKSAQSSMDRVELRIKDLHAKLRITAEQEPLWNNMAQVMRQNAKTMSDDLANRDAKLKQKNMSAIDDLKSYQIIADEHADGLKRLIPAFGALYVQMSPAQQKNADHVFDVQQHRTTHKS